MVEGRLFQTCGILTKKEYLKALMWDGAQKNEIMSPSCGQMLKFKVRITVQLMNNLENLTARQDGSPCGTSVECMPLGDHA